MRALRTQLALARDRIEKLEVENDQLRRCSPASNYHHQFMENGAKNQFDQDESIDDNSGSRLFQLEQRLNYAENMCQDYRDENTVLKCELRELQVLEYVVIFSETPD